jgi:hypothetical protein
MRVRTRVSLRQVVSFLEIQVMGGWLGHTSVSYLASVSGVTMCTAPRGYALLLLCFFAPLQAGHVHAYERTCAFTGPFQVSAGELPHGSALLFIAHHVCACTLRMTGCPDARCTWSRRSLLYPFRTSCAVFERRTVCDCLGEKRVSGEPLPPPSTSLCEISPLTMPPSAQSRTARGL